MRLSMGRFRWRRWWCPLWISLGMVSSQGSGLAAELGSTCSAAGILHPHGLLVPALGEAEQLIAVRRDGLLGSAWGVVMDCRHPEWPARMIALVGDADISTHVEVSATASVAPRVVRAGQRVRLWRQDAATRIEASGSAEESGTEGQRIRVRLVRTGSDAGEGKEFVVGVVRGAGSVEILQ